MIYLVEHFFSFQGEGLYSGTPSIFLRFGGCNLGCSGFGCEITSPKDGTNLIGCDSQKAVKKEHFVDSWDKVSSDELIEIVDKYFMQNGYISDVVITGGEPLLNYHDDVMIDLLEYLKFKGSRVTIETNATIKIDFDKYPIYKSATFSMSIKLSNSGESYEKRIHPEAIERIVKSSNNHYFKFAIDKEYIQKFANQEIRSLTMMYQSSLIYCMPLGESISKLSQNDNAIIEFCKENNYRFSDRTHIRVYNKRDGV